MVHALEVCKITCINRKNVEKIIFLRKPVMEKLL